MALSASTRPAAPPAADRRPRSGTRGWARWMFYSHLWLGVVTTGIVLIICVTGVLLNHKRPLGLMPDVPNDSPGALPQSLPLAELAARAERAVRPEVAASGIDRMDVRPGDGFVKVRFDDREVHEVTVDLASGRVLHVGLRNDVFLEKLHSGEIFGDGWTLLSDVAAIALAILVISGLWLWLYPRARA
ncbi:MAG TPA: PepSY-associated TM helix domain-containing protein [Longimicrobium sp.]|nr:PepSY-associated TM helix domain-containing protein [Longimicrobium sp.]